MDDQGFVEQFERMLAFLRDKLTPEDVSTVEGFFLDDSSRTHSVLGMDSRRIIREIHAIREAEDEVRPFVGDVIACDSVPSVYKQALVKMGQDVAPLHPNAMREVFRMLCRRGARPRVASDAVMLTPRAEASPPADITERFPNFNRLGRSA